MVLALSTIVLAVLAILIGFLLIPVEDKNLLAYKDKGEENKNPPTGLSGKDSE